MRRFIGSSSGLMSALLLGWAIALLAPVSVSAFSSGIDQGASGCNPCHGSDAAPGLGVTITGPSTLLPGATGSYLLTIDTLNVGGALSVETSDGTLTDVDVNTQVLNSMITHVAANDPGPIGSLGDWEYNFELTAPATVGVTVILSATGMAFNGNFTADSGDTWNNLGSPFSVTVIPEPSTGLLIGMGLGLLGAAARRQGTRRSLRLR